MIKELVEYTKKLPASLIKKSSVEDEVDSILSGVRVNIVPMVTSIGNMIKSSPNLDKFSNLPLFKGSALDKEYKTVSAYVKALSTFSNNVLSNDRNILAYVSSFPNTISTRGMTTNQAIAFNFMDNMRFFIDSTGDILTLLTESILDSETVYAPKIIQQKKLLVTDNVAIMKAYFDVKKVLVDLKNIVITEAHLLESVLDDSRGVVVDRFIGNPIVYIRLRIVDWELSRINKLEAEREYIELLLAKWELDKNNMSNPQLEKQIEKAKELLNQIDLKIAKLRAS